VFRLIASSAFELVADDGREKAVGPFLGELA
jgi:hypothetical protein